MSSRDHKRGKEIHYHYYGSEAAQRGAQDFAQAYAPPPGNGPYAPQPGKAPPGTGGAYGSGATPFNRHRHPNADSLVKGLAVGAGAAYLLTNETAQHFVLRSAAQLWTLLRRGAEEIKEKFQDAEAEVVNHLPDEDAAATHLATTPKD